MKANNIKRIFTLLLTIILITGTMGALLYSNICNIAADDTVFEDQKNSSENVIDDFNGIFEEYQKKSECNSIKNIGPALFGDYIVYVITNDKYLYEIRFCYDDLNSKVIRLFFDDLTEDMDSWIAAIRKTLFRDNKLSKDEKNELKKVKNGEKVTIRGYDFYIDDVADKYKTSKKKYLEIDFPKEEKMEETKDTSGGQTSNTETETIEKKNQEMSIDVSSVTIDPAELKDSDKTVDKSEIFTINNARGKVTFKKKSGSDFLDISKKGALTIAEGTEEGEYSISVLVKASGDDEYNWTSQVVDIDVIIKNQNESEQETESLTESVKTAVDENNSSQEVSNDNENGEQVNVWDDSSKSITLLSEDDVTAEFRGIYEKSNKSWIINLYVENNKESEIYPSIKDVLINDCMISLSNNGRTIPAGTKYLAGPSFDFIIDTEDLEYYGVTHIDEIDYILEIRESMFGDVYYSTPVKIVMNKEVPVTGKGSYTIKRSLLDNDDICIDYCGLDDYSAKSKIISIYAENFMDKDVYIDFEDVVINGFSMKLANNNKRILPHSKYLSAPGFDFVIDTDDFEAYGIEDIESLECVLCVKDGFVGNMIYSESVKLI